MSQTFDWTESRLVQFNTSPAINHILQGLNDMLGLSEAELVAKVFNVDTATGKQLDVIGKLVGANREVTFPVVSADQDFGFDDVTWYGFDEHGGTFDEKESSGVFILNDNAYREHIKLKAYMNISNCSLYSINFILKTIFAGRGLCYAKQTGPLEVTFTFHFELTDSERNLLNNRYIPVPAGYESRIIEIP